MCTIDKRILLFCLNEFVESRLRDHKRLLYNCDSCLPEPGFEPVDIVCIFALAKSCEVLDVFTMYAICHYCLSFSGSETGYPMGLYCPSYTIERSSDIAIIMALQEEPRQIIRSIVMNLTDYLNWETMLVKWEQ